MDATSFKPEAKAHDAIEAALNPLQTHEPDMPGTTRKAPAEKRVARSR